MNKLSGGCHCQNIRYTATIPFAIDELAIRSCPCGYCRLHGGIYGAHPDMSVEVDVKISQEVTKYRFASCTTDFMICKKCGIIAIVTDEIDSQHYALLRINTLDDPIVRKEIPIVNNEGEDSKARRERRKAKWAKCKFNS